MECGVFSTFPYQHHLTLAQVSYVSCSSNSSSDVNSTVRFHPFLSLSLSVPLVLWYTHEHTIHVENHVCCKKQTCTNHTHMYICYSCTRCTQKKMKVQKCMNWSICRAPSNKHSKSARTFIAIHTEMSIPCMRMFGQTLKHMHAYDCIYTPKPNQHMHIYIYIYLI